MIDKIEKFVYRFKDSAEKIRRDDYDDVPYIDQAIFLVLSVLGTIYKTAKELLPWMAVYYLAQILNKLT